MILESRTSKSSSQCVYQAQGYSPLSIWVIYIAAVSVVFVNPMWVMFSLGLANCVKKFRFGLIGTYVVAATAGTLLSRHIGVKWTKQAYDDLPTWIGLFHDLKYESWGNILDNFLRNPSGNELLSISLWKALGVLGFGSDGFVIVLYLLFAILNLIAVRTLSPRYWSYLYACYIFSPGMTALYSQSNVLRQQLAFSLMFVAMALITSKKWRMGGLAVIVTPFAHLSALLMIPVIGFSHLLLRLRKPTSMVLLLAAAFFATGGILYLFLDQIVMSFYAFDFFGNIIMKIEYYSQANIVQGRATKSIPLIVLSFMILRFGFRKKKYFVVASMLMALSVLVLEVITPALGAFTNRLFILVLPLMSVGVGYAILTMISSPSIKVLMMAEFLILLMVVFVLNSYGELGQKFMYGQLLHPFYGPFGMMTDYTSIDEQVN